MHRAFHVVALSVAFLSVGSVVHAQQPMQMPSCDGKMSILRLSEVKPGKSATFLQAAAAQQAWYSSKGSADTIHVLRVGDMNTGAWSETEYITNHVETAAQPKQDEGYAAFVKLYQESSTIKSQWLTCEKK